MNSASSSPQAKEAKMFEYSIRINFVSGSFSIEKVQDTNPASAVAVAVSRFGSETVESTTLLGSIDLKPQVFLAW